MRICIFAGSRRGNDPGYALAAREVGTTLAQRGIGIVYGGGSTGLMGALADAALLAGGEVVGVIPRNASWSEEENHALLTKCIRVRDLAERKAVMDAYAHGFLVLPGGLGTYDELFDVLARRQLQLMTKPLGLLNVNGFFDPFKQLLHWSMQQGFVSANEAFVFEDRFLLEDTELHTLINRLEDAVHYQRKDATGWHLV